MLLAVLLAALCAAETMDYREYTEVTVLVPEFVGTESMDTYVCMFDMQSGTTPRCMFRDDAVRYADAYFRQEEATQLMQQNADLGARLEATDRVRRSHDKYILYRLIIWAIFGTAAVTILWLTRRTKQNS